VEFVVDNVEVGQVFSQYFGFSCQFSFHRLLHIHLQHLSPGAGAIGQLVANLLYSQEPSAEPHSVQDESPSQAIYLKSNSILSVIDLYVSKVVSSLPIFQ
jgi:hypothetical protein